MAGIRDAIMQPKGYVKVTGLSSAVQLSASVPSGASRCLLKVETQPVRWRDDGSNPTSTDGMLIDVGDEFWYTGQVKALRFIETAASATLHISFYA